MKNDRYFMYISFMFLLLLILRTAPTIGFGEYSITFMSIMFVILDYIQEVRKK